METHEQHHEEKHHVIGLIPSIIFLVALAIVVIWYSFQGGSPH